ncbi:hypothetical protein DFQ03_2606 [Maribacter caenipelagi]|uniref:Uncharacterized protein n=1 Tax=Maribacter caenipelagi TaxID=1447781 RepID=A0A4R7CYC2_9FLAO|nr:hypothetical protein [Maribacter caenipelagi]TDS13320.1 hypothetical protein DFQ03_2606 [Maribacter caenipelagi]|tara:strand:+ start:78 stop:584 length:507 start_codon:yes stop_codon:yes gene_type:complete
MKKYLLIGCSILFFGCNDGDLQIETVDFDSIETVQSCNDISTTTENVLFKINGDEALILTIPSGLLKNEVTVSSLESAVPGNSQISYRIFSETVTSAYFCDSPPPLTPTVLEEIEAEGGSIIVTTTTEDSTTFTHTIQLSGITFLNENGSRITDLQINEFGTVTTTIE